MIPPWKVNEKTKSMMDYRVPFGDALVSVAQGLRALETSAPTEGTLRRVSASISVAVHKILFGNQPLLRCVEKPTLPSLADNRLLDGDVYELWKPIYLTIEPPEPQPPSSLARGVAICNLSAVFPLHGLAYKADTNQFQMSWPWNNANAGLSLAKWGRQELVQANATTMTVREVVSRMRNKRGAHVDIDWTNNMPQPARTFFEFYASVFVVLAGWYLVQEAARAAKSKTFRQLVFDTAGNMDQELRLPTLPCFTWRTKPKEVLPDRPTWSWEFGEAMRLFHIPDRGSGTVSYCAYLWFIRAAGIEMTERDKARLKALKQIAMDWIIKREKGETQSEHPRPAGGSARRR